MRSSGLAVAAAAMAMVWGTAAWAQQDPAPPEATDGPAPGARVNAPGTGGSGTVSTRSEETVSVEETKVESGHWLKGASILVGGGVEGYTGSLASRVAVGPAWNVIVGIHPSSVFGLEFAYQGALNSVKYGNFGLATQGGADIVRTAGQAAVTFAFGPWKLQPFVLAGLGINHDSVSDNARAVGFSSGTNGYVPVGGGIRGQVEGVMVDLRGSWQLPFSDNLFPGSSGQNTLGLSTGNFGRWNATLNVGGTF
jgi:hypothetical protein